MAEVNLELLQGLMQRVLAELTGVRREQAEMRHEHAGMHREQAEMRRQNGEMRSIVLLLADQGRHIERKVGEARDEIELMAKPGLMARLGRCETHIEARLDALALHAT